QRAARGLPAAGGGPGPEGEGAEQPDEGLVHGVLHVEIRAPGRGARTQTNPIERLPAGAAHQRAGGGGACPYPSPCPGGPGGPTLCGECRRAGLFLPRGGPGGVPATGYARITDSPGGPVKKSEKMPRTRASPRVRGGWAARKELLSTDRDRWPGQEEAGPGGL